MYAASHASKLPEKLSDAGVPLPADPFTGKPFTYTLNRHHREASKCCGHPCTTCSVMSVPLPNLR